MYAKYLLALTLAFATLASAAPMGIAEAGLDVAVRKATPEAESTFTDPDRVLVRNDGFTIEPDRVL